jgi:hypothetical protein
LPTTQGQQLGGAETETPQGQQLGGAETEYGKATCVNAIKPRAIIRAIFI